MSGSRSSSSRIKCEKPQRGDKSSSVGEDRSPVQLWIHEQSLLLRAPNEQHILLPPPIQQNRQHNRTHNPESRNQHYPHVRIVKPSSYPKSQKPPVSKVPAPSFCKTRIISSQDFKIALRQSLKMPYFPLSVPAVRLCRSNGRLEFIRPHDNIGHIDLFSSREEAQRLTEDARSRIRRQGGYKSARRGQVPEWNARPKLLEQNYVNREPSDRPLHNGPLPRYVSLLPEAARRKSLHVERRRPVAGAPALIRRPQSREPNPSLDEPSPPASPSFMLYKDSMYRYRDFEELPPYRSIPAEPHMSGALQRPETSRPPSSPLPIESVAVTNLESWRDAYPLPRASRSRSPRGATPTQHASLVASEPIDEKSVQEARDHLFALAIHESERESTRSQRRFAVSSEEEDVSRAISESLVSFSDEQQRTSHVEHRSRSPTIPRQRYPAPSTRTMSTPSPYAESVQDSETDRPSTLRPSSRALRRYPFTSASRRQSSVSPNRTLPTASASTLSSQDISDNSSDASSPRPSTTSSQRRVHWADQSRLTSISLQDETGVRPTPLLLNGDRWVVNSESRITELRSLRAELERLARRRYPNATGFNFERSNVGRHGHYDAVLTVMENIHPVGGYLANTVGDDVDGLKELVCLANQWHGRRR